MTTETIPLITVADIKINIDYLVKTLGFKLDFATTDGSTAILNRHGVLLKLQESAGDGSSAMPENFTEIQVKVEDIEEIYKSALSKGAIIRRYIESAKHNDGKIARRFTVSLPDRYLLTFIK